MTKHKIYELTQLSFFGKKIKFLLTFCTLVCFFSNEILAESLADKLKKKLEKALDNGQSQVQSEKNFSIEPGSISAPLPETTPSTPAATGNVNPNKTSSASSILGNPESWCKEQAGLIAGRKINNSLIAEEFKIQELDSLQDLFWDPINSTSSLRAFSNAKLWKSSFETKKVRGLYNAFVAFPEPAILAVIIDMSRNASDKQEKNDAAMALAFIHLSAPNLSIKSDRWSELHKQAGTEHWTALVFKARLNAYGESGLKQDNRTALGYLVQAGNKKNEYLQSRGRYEWDKSNYEIPYNVTATEITSKEVGKYPAWEQLNGFLAKVEVAEREYILRWPTSRAGKLSKISDQLVQESEELGVKTLKLSQGGNAGAGALANIESLRSNKANDKQTFAYIDPKVEAMTLNLVKQSSDLSSEQKKLLEQAHEKRISAQGIIAQVNFDISAYMLSNVSIGGGNMEDGLARIAAVAPAAMKMQDTLIQSCVISSKWEQAMRAKNVNVSEKSKSSNDLIKLNAIKDE